MPPKRKRNDEPAADVTTSSARTTRRSVRTSNAEAASTSKATTRKSRNEAEDQLSSESTPPAKKAKTTTRKASTKTKNTTTKTAAKTSRALSSNDDDVVVQKDVVPDAFEQTKTLTAVNESPPAKVQSSLPRPTLNEPYNAEHARALFKKYEDTDEPNTIGPEGFVRLCDDAKVAMEGALPLILAWQFGTTEMMKITEEEWRKGTGSLKISNLSALHAMVRDLEELLILGAPLPPKKAKKDVYDKTAYWKQSKTINMETATALWSALLVPKFPLMEEVVGFIGVRARLMLVNYESQALHDAQDHATTYRAANKDLWSMMLEFCETVNPNLSDYESDGAWPTLLDNFVIWKKGQTGNALSS
ncbi:hypothetical protein C0992_010168 [Termitomyces sp. T32_za158]|nr:hypothetical protein C0992_010168 [Termitomyces sp. T32_za158]